jgi:hypothetical protein
VNDLNLRYHTHCDPRLNGVQVRMVVMIIIHMMMMIIMMMMMMMMMMMTSP